jgi:hypothetical protein
MTKLDHLHGDIEPNWNDYLIHNDELPERKKSWREREKREERREKK